MGCLMWALRAIHVLKMLLGIHVAENRGGVNTRDILDPFDCVFGGYE